MSSTETARERFEAAMGLFELATAMVRQKTLRNHPNATEEELAASVRRWVQKRPGAPGGDAEGTVYPSLDAWMRRQR